MGVVRTKSGLTSTNRTTHDQLIIFIDIITKIHFLEGRRRSRCMPGSASASASSHTNLEPHFILFVICYYLLLFNYIYFIIFNSILIYIY